MTINEYQGLAMTTLNPELDKKDVLINGVMGLCGEAGEAIDIVKKHLAQGHELDREKLIGELGDIAWYLAETAMVAVSHHFIAFFPQIDGDLCLPPCSFGPAHAFFSAHFFRKVFRWAAQGPY
jgi:NTP pyrophosphatase (non-canonical NTP hydrolase)